MDIVTPAFRTEEQASRGDLLRLLIETATNHALFTLDRDGIVTSWNPGAERIKGYRADEIIGRSFACFYTEPDRAEKRPLKALAFAAKQGRYEEEGVRVRKDGTIFPAEVVIYAMRDRTGALTGYAKIARDITSRIERKMALAESEAKSRLLAHLGHEFRTPLNAIIAFSEIMNRRLYGELGDQHYASYADDIHTSGLHLLGMVDTLLDLARIEVGKMTPVPQPVDVAAVVGYAARVLGLKARAKNIRIVTAISGEVARFMADDRMVRQCLVNLIDNAIKYSPAGTLVHLTVERLGPWLVINVVDQGKGIAKEDIPKALEPFRQLGDVMTRQRDGMGLGLTLVKSFCELQGGSLAIESEPNKGTRATLIFPYPGNSRIS